MAIEQIVDPNNIYVRAGAMGRDGALGILLGSITEGITTVNIGGTVLRKH